jgi:hypothetical protein
MPTTTAASASAGAATGTDSIANGGAAAVDAAEHSGHASDLEVRNCFKNDLFIHSSVTVSGTFCSCKYLSCATIVCAYSTANAVY